MNRDIEFQSAFVHPRIPPERYTSPGKRKQNQLEPGTTDQATGKQEGEIEDATQSDTDKNKIVEDGPAVEEGNGENAHDVQSANDADFSQEPEHMGGEHDSTEAEVGVDDNTEAETKVEGDEGEKGSGVEDAEDEDALFGSDESSSDEEDRPSRAYTSRVKFCMHELFG